MLTALVEFVEPFEARKAFTKLAYSKFKHLPLYLEWAPDDSFTSPSNVKVENKVSTKDKNNETSNKSMQNEIINENKEKIENETKEDIKEDEKEEEEDDEDEPEPDTTLFVKNLNFSSTEEGLKKVCLYFLKILQIK